MTRWSRPVDVGPGGVAGMFVPEELLLDISALEAWREKIENRSKDTAKNRKSVGLQN